MRLHSQTNPPRRDGPASGEGPQPSSLGRVVAALAVSSLGCGACTSDEVRSLDLFPRSAATADVGCQFEGDCPAERRHCQQGSCVQCTSDAHCPGMEPACLRGACVECTASAHCGVGYDCNTKVNQCAFRCDEASDCAGQKQSRCALSAGYCVECRADLECEGMRPRCLSEPGRCVECIADSDCAGARDVCDLVTARCVECIVDADCPTGICELGAGHCVECRVDEQCPPAHSCERERCVAACVGDEDCPDTQQCRQDIGACAQCGVSADCADSAAPQCNATGQCVECLQDSHCVDPSKPGCIQATERCAECTRDEHCEASHSCDLRSAKCVAQ